MYRQRLYHDLVSHFAANKRKTRIYMRDDDACTFRFRQETLCNNEGYEA